MKTIFYVLFILPVCLLAQTYTTHKQLHVFPNGDSVITSGKTEITIDFKNKLFTKNNGIPAQTETSKILSREKAAAGIEKSLLIEKTGAAGTYSCKVELHVPKTATVFNTKYRQLLVVHEKEMTVFYYLD